MSTISQNLKIEERKKDICNNKKQIGEFINNQNCPPGKERLRDLRKLLQDSIGREDHVNININLNCETPQNQAKFFAKYHKVSKSLGRLSKTKKFLRKRVSKFFIRSRNTIIHRLH